MTETDSSHTDVSYKICGWPHELDDALHRLNQAKADFESLASEIDKFHYEYVKGMLKGRGPAGEATTIRLRHPNDSFVKGKPAVLVAQIAENLRAALDYTVYQLSKSN